MTDMLVKLYDLPETLSTFSNLVAPDITIRKPIGTERWTHGEELNNELLLNINSLLEVEVIYV
mgnify:CR=1 FL=1